LIVTWGLDAEAEIYTHTINAPPNVSSVIVSGTHDDDLINGLYVDIEGNTISNYADFVSSGQGDDFVVGLSGDDVLHGDDGNDTLDGNLGIDELFGGEGADVFVLSIDQSADEIGDFDALEGDLIRVLGVNNFSDLELTIVNEGTEVRLLTGELLGSVFDTVNLSADDFDFL
jgi:Ca2+-binding RTX toxin-like protein